MKHLVSIFSFLFLSMTAFSQAPDYKDLIILYADGTPDSYKKLVKEAEKYTLKDDSKKDIPPYFWLAKGLYEISLSGEQDEEFKNAYKDAIKFLGKGMAYDVKYNDGNYTVEEEEFVELFQSSLFEYINNEIIMSGYKRSYGWVLKYTKIAIHEVGANYLMGTCKYEDNDKSSAREYWKTADAQLAEITTLEGWSPADRTMLKHGVLHSVASLKRSRQDEKAKELLGKVSQWFEEDEDWQDLYDEIVNKPKD